MTKHKARLNAELTKARLKRGFASVEALRIYVENGNINGSGHGVAEGLSKENQTNEGYITGRSHPRWIRVNTLRTSLEEQLATTFSQHKAVDSVAQIMLATNGRSNTKKLLYVDDNIPNLLAISPTADVSNNPAYRNGLIILQDKASCFPAYLLDPQPGDVCLDACAAPGNKTTHLAALVQSHGKITQKPKVWACERDKDRSRILRKMIATAGAEDIIEVKAPQDFLRLDPHKAPWNNVTSFLLDPSCSGSGIIGREDTRTIVLPSKRTQTPGQANSRKRKRKAEVELAPDFVEVKEETPMSTGKVDVLRNRLEALSAFQLKLVLRAFEFPKARKISYSTCSIHAEENEHVVLKALTSSLAKQRGWHILCRAAQVSGMKAWGIRGDIVACKEMLTKDAIEGVDVDEIAEACIRCEKGTMEGTQGFFVAAFVREGDDLPISGVKGEADHEELEHEEAQEWEGFDD